MYITGLTLGEFLRSIVNYLTRKWIEIMKIAILTWLHNGNYGTLLQAYALQSFLKGEGYEVSNIDFKPSTIEKVKNLIKCHNSLSLIREKFDGYLSRKQGEPELLSKRNLAFEQFMNQNINLTKQYSKADTLTDLSGKYDAYICRWIKSGPLCF